VGVSGRGRWEEGGGGVAGFCLHDGMRVPVVFLESFAESDATMNSDVFLFLLC
jgi:hypothetical protein